MAQEKCSSHKTTIKISWEEIREYSWRLGLDIADLYPELTHIIAVARGGLVPASLIAYQLGIRYVDTLCLETYENATKLGRSRLIKAPIKPLEVNKTIIIDDIVDTGTTLTTIRKLIPEVGFASLFSKLKKPDHLTAELINPEVWYKFPWSDEQPKE